jgi:hypothetical protein
MLKGKLGIIKEKFRKKSKEFQSVPANEEDIKRNKWYREFDERNKNLKTILVACAKCDKVFEYNIDNPNKCTADGCGEWGLSPKYFGAIKKRIQEYEHMRFKYVENKRIEDTYYRKNGI